MANYNSTHTGSQIDSAVARALAGGAIDKSIEQANSEIGKRAPAIESADFPGCYYRTVNGATEWLNPPLQLDVEYRTTERYLGKPVYVRLVNCGNMPSAGGSKTVQAPYEDTANQMRYAWIYNAHLTHHGQALPSFFPGEVAEIRAAVSTTGTGLIQIIANGNTDWTDANAKLYVSLKYIKNTD